MLAHSRGSSCLHGAVLGVLSWHGRRDGYFGHDSCNALDGTMSIWRSVFAIRRCKGFTRSDAHFDSLFQSRDWSLGGAFGFRLPFIAVNIYVYH